MHEQMNNAFDWQREPEAAVLVDELLASALQCNASAKRFGDRLLAETGTRLLDWVDHLRLPADEATAERLLAAGFTPQREGELHVFRHDGGIFPALALATDAQPAIVIRVDSVADFAVRHRFDEFVIAGEPIAPVRRATMVDGQPVAFEMIERHGSTACGIAATSSAEFDVRAILRIAEALRRRPRRFDDDAVGFSTTMTLIDQAIEAVGVDRAADLFFAAEREYWQNRNLAARLQKMRQDGLGVGWANHDHHTYRSSRANFVRLVAALERLGLHCRERFYAGREAGWGAQVLEQPNAGIVVFADVDLSADEVAGDFAHEPLPKRDEFGTVGLWCALHGDSFLQAGMHHLECQFDFTAARKQLARAGVESMKPFTDFEHLKQSFTKGEIWPVDPARIETLVQAGRITEEQARTFRREGAIGSHLEVLERNDGYKGFNQTGINEIIRETDPRAQQVRT